MKHPARLILLAFGLSLAIGTGFTAPLPEKFRNPDTVTLDTNHGLIRFKLFPKKAPASVANFLKYVDDGFYKDTVFHRVIPDFMIQGGGMDADLTEKRARPPVKNESANGLSNKRGTVAVARAADPDSGTVQFFINLRDNPQLDQQANRPGYCVFGEVIEGMAVVDRIAKVATGNQGQHQNVPRQAVLIRSVRRSN